jgi:hypothetical protein
VNDRRPDQHWPAPTNQIDQQK